MTRQQTSVKRSGGKPDKPLTHAPRRLWRRRIAAGMTIRDLSRESGVAIGAISDLENGKQSAQVGTLAALAKALGCEITDLMPDEANGSAA